MDGLPAWVAVLFIPVLVVVALVLFALVDAFRTPLDRWHAARLSKYLWISIIWYSFGLGAVLYLWRVRPLLRAPATVNVVDGDARVR